MFPLLKIKYRMQGRVGLEGLSSQYNQGLDCVEAGLQFWQDSSLCLGHPDSQGRATRDYKSEPDAFVSLQLCKTAGIRSAQERFKVSSLASHSMELQNLVLRGKLTLCLMSLSLQCYHSSPTQMPKLNISTAASFQIQA